MKYAHHYDSPLGRITAVSDGECLTRLYFDDSPASSAASPNIALFDALDRWLDAYFGGTIPDFMPPLSLRSTPFQLAVWDAIRAVPYGSTATYGEIAARLGKPGCARAVGAAVARNPIAILIPCHRIVGAGGALTGYAWGIERKRWLLEWERGRGHA